MRITIFVLLNLYVPAAIAQNQLIPKEQLGDRISEFSSTVRSKFLLDNISAHVEERSGPKLKFDKYFITILKGKIDSAFRLRMLFNDTAVANRFKHIPDSSIIIDRLMPELAVSFAYRVINIDTSRHNDTISITVRLDSNKNYCRQFSLLELVRKVESYISFDEKRKLSSILEVLLPPYRRDLKYKSMGFNAWKEGPSRISFYGSVSFYKPGSEKEQQVLYKEVKSLFKAGKHPNLAYRWKCKTLEFERSDSNYVAFKGTILLIINPGH